MRRRRILREYVAWLSLLPIYLFRRSIASRTSVAYCFRLPIQNPDDIPSARCESHPNIFTILPLPNVFGDPTAAITVPQTPVPISPDAPPPSGNPAKLLISNSEMPHVVTIMIERPPIMRYPVCVKDKRFLDTGGFHTKRAYRFGIGSMMWIRFVL